MELIKVITNTGSKYHLTVDGLKTLCARPFLRPGHGAEITGSCCLNCTRAASKIDATPVEPQAELPAGQPVDVTAWSVASGQRETVAHIPNGDPERVALFVATYVDQWHVFAEVRAVLATSDQTETTSGTLPQYANDTDVRAALDVLTDVRLATLSGDAYASNPGASGYVVEPRGNGWIRFAWLDVVNGQAEIASEYLGRRKRPNVAAEDLEAAGWLVESMSANGWTLARRPETTPDAEDAGYQETDAISDAMFEKSTDDAPYGAVDASLVDDETRERALYDGDVFELSTGRTAPIADAPVTTWRMIDSTTGEMIKPGTERPDFRGETWRIVKISRTPEIGKEGKVLATTTDGKGWTQELYPSVFGLVITDSEITPDMAGCWLDGHCGWHNNYRVVDCASEFGFRVPGEYRADLQEYRINGADCNEDAWENIAARGGLADMATEFLHNRAPEGYTFVWDMGEFSLMTDADAEMI